MIVRHPFSRLVSAYEDKMLNPKPLLEYHKKVQNEIKKRNSNDVFNLWKSSKFSRILKGDSRQNITYFLKRKEVGNTRQCYRIQNIFTPHLQGKDWRNSCKKISNQNQFSTFYVLRFFFLLFSDRMSQLNEAETFSIHW